MRKKLLALVMCATMVLGTAVTSSAATLVEADYKAADTIIDQYEFFAGEFNNGKFGTETWTEATFVSNYERLGGAVAQYKYAFKTNALPGIGDYVDYVKVNAKNVPYVNVSGKGTATASVDSTSVTNLRQVVLSATDYAAVATGDTVLVKANDGAQDHYFYISDADNYTVNDTNVYNSTLAVKADSKVTNASVSTGDAVIKITSNADRKVLTVKEYNPKDKTSISEYVPDGQTKLQNSFGVDVDGYIPLAASGEDANVVKLYTTVSKDYYVAVSKASADKVDIANAFHEGLISKDAVAVHFDFYKLNTAAVPVLSYGNNANQSTMQELRYCRASREETPVTLTTDWLSRTNLKSASGVSAYILDEFVPSIANTFTRIGSLVKVADVADGKFTADYVISGTYIFDVAAAADNAGQADADKTTDSTSSPKTGDVAPIAALAVVMMGAFGAMVVASKKRA